MLGRCHPPAGAKLLSAPERSASVLAAAARVFAAGGYARTSIDDIAAEAGITKNSSSTGILPPNRRSTGP
uniref:TetR family transcriptional regulator n=1 Tax=Fodinicola feengrottensis TaxID=435914 RepID=UPI0013D3C789